MIVLTIGSDAKLFEKGSSVRQRACTQASIFDEVHIVVISTHIKLGTQVDNSEKRLFLYPIVSKYKLLLFFAGFVKTLLYIRRLKKRESDIYITSQDPFEIGLISAALSFLFGLRLQLQFHTDCFSEIFRRHSVINLLKSFIAHIIIRRARSIRVVSERIRNSIIQRYPELIERVYVLPVRVTTVDVSRTEISRELDLRARFKEFKKIILVLSRLESEKNIELALMSFSKILRSNKTIGMVIVGSGSKEDWLKRYVTFLKIDSNVRFLGWQRDVFSLYKSSDMLLVTSWYEGYGLTIVESLMCGTPVFSTDVGVASEVGAFIIPYDAGTIAKRVLELFQGKLLLPQKNIVNYDDVEYWKKFKATFN